MVLKIATNTLGTNISDSFTDYLTVYTRFSS